jgi:hypothetical protein
MVGEDGEAVDGGGRGTAVANAPPRERWELRWRVTPAVPAGRGRGRGREGCGGNTRCSCRVRATDTGRRKGFVCRGIRVGDKLEDPPCNLGHRRGFAAASCGAVEEGRVPIRGGARAGEEIAGFWLQVHGLTGAEDGADAEVGVAEALGEEPRAVNLGECGGVGGVGECP